MYIKSIVIDGFKSYGQRTEVNGFDPAFNAITGLNGSGKSNILDAICFLLGITNLTHVRATNLQELVYKNGQAGVTKATVSISFDNRNKKQSPQGYEQYDEVVITRQVVIGGKNKYLINGTNIQNNRVQDFFKSVQLNVNNPHFLIMQGRITKVLNMKPPEILSLIEEAAGTMFYENKKQAAQKTIEKKDAKLREINDILNEEITPTLTKLKEERTTYLEYQKIQRELDHLTKLYVAYKFIKAEEMASKADLDLGQIIEKKAKLEEESRAYEQQIREIGEQLAELQRARDQELGGRLKEVEAEAKEKDKETLKIDADIKANNDAKKQEDKKRNQIVKGMNTDKKMLEEKQAIVGKMQEVYDSLKEENRKCTEALKAAQKRYEAISMGKFSDGEGESATLQQQVMNLKAEMTQASTQIKTAEMKLEHDTQALKKHEAELKKYERENASDTSNLKKYESEVEKAAKSLENLGYQEGSYEEAERRLRDTDHEVRKLRKHVMDMSHKSSGIDFHYQDPEPNFDRRKVHGVAASLIKVKDLRFSTALDQAGGGKLRNVIVETDDVAAKLLKRGNLQYRATFLPLNKMNARTISDHQLRAAHSLVSNKNQVQRAIDLIEYDNRLQPAMAYIMGNVLICSDIHVAKKVAYDPRVQCLCVTLDGDKVNPSGEMSGGAAIKTGSFLAHIAQVMEAKKSLEEKEREFAQIASEEKRLRNMDEQFRHLQNQHFSKSKELEQIHERMKNTDHHRLNEKVKDLKADIETSKQQIVEAKEIEKDRTQKHKDALYKIKNADELKKKELKEAEKAVKEAKKAEETAKQNWSSKEAEEDTIKMEITSLQKSVETAENQLGTNDEAIQGLAEEAEKLKEKLSGAKSVAKEAHDAVKIQKEALASNRTEITSLQSKSEKMTKAEKDRELKVQELTHNITRAKDDAGNAKRVVQGLLEQYEWISEERKFFGQPNTAYDFKATDPQEASRRIKKLEDTKGKLEKTVNMRAMNMLGKAEEQFNDLMRKKTTVENDKAKINKVIKELDVKKKAEIRVAWDKVNKDFGSIFSTLLPGTQAKLQPPDGGDVIEDGLEVKVAFGDVWKESLAELSGGQRSLVALSLILSLLLFRPAPLYILDEVDAALDLSHTQNIGRMLKTHFQHSQFIVVSLKDGMFNNANVLFRTKFVDGMSTVSRTAHIQKK